MSLIKYYNESQSLMKLFIFSTDFPKVSLNEIQDQLTSLSTNAVIRTSGSKGLDSIIPDLPVKSEIHIPWEGFNSYRTCNKDEKSNATVVCPKVTKPALDILNEHVLGELHPKYVKIDNRLVTGLLGEDLNSPVDLAVINNVDSALLPTTSSALLERIAFSKGIRVVNLDYVSLGDFQEVLDTIT